MCRFFAHFCFFPKRLTYRFHYRLLKSSSNLLECISPVLITEYLPESGVATLDPISRPRLAGYIQTEIWSIRRFITFICELAIFLELLGFCRFSWRFFSLLPTWTIVPKRTIKQPRIKVMFTSPCSR